MMAGRLLWSAIAAVLVGLFDAPSSRAAGREHKDADAAAVALFTDGRVPRLQIRLSEEAAESLRSEPRKWVRGTVVEDGDTYERVAVRIKGSYGSFRDLDDRPALTIDMDRHERGRRFHGLGRFHLNNAVQDESLLRELLGSEIFRSACIPAPRVTHARVSIDGRDLGLYVLKESFDEDFLRRSFARPDGNLYDGGAGQEIDEGLERDAGRRGDAGADLASLAAACRLVDDDARWRAIENGVDVDAFLAFAAVEAMAGHWNGYCNARNNYRLYFDPGLSVRGRFLPHGMDQIFTDAHAGLLDPPNALVAAAILENPEWRRRYRGKIREMLPLFAAEERLLPVVAGAVDRLRPIVVAMGLEPLERFDAAVAALRAVIGEREASLRQQAEAGGPLVWPTRLQAAVRTLNAADDTPDEAEIPNARADVFLRDNVPWFECPDLQVERAYYRRWWTLRRHVRHKDEGSVLEGLPDEFGDPLAEARWLSDLRLVGLAAHPRPGEAGGGLTCDGVIRQFAGLRVHPDNTLEVEPCPPDGWAWFALDRIAYQGRRLAIVWDETGEHYGRGAGLRVFVDGAEVARSETLGRIVNRLP